MLWLLALIRYLAPTSRAHYGVCFFSSANQLERAQRLRQVSCDSICLILSGVTPKAFPTSRNVYPSCRCRTAHSLRFRQLSRSVGSTGFFGASVNIRPNHQHRASDIFLRDLDRVNTTHHPAPCVHHASPPLGGEHQRHPAQQASLVP